MYIISIANCNVIITKYLTQNIRNTILISFLNTF